MPGLEQQQDEQQSESAQPLPTPPTTTTSSIANHDSPPSASSTTSSAKRKRSTSPSPVNNQAKNSSSVKSVQPTEEDIRESISDIWTVLESHDPSTYILDELLPPPTPKTEDDGPSAKRTKLTPENKHKTISAKVRAGAYSSLTQFITEVEDALTAVNKTAVEAKARAQTGSDAASQDYIIVQSKALIHFFKTLSGREIRRLNPTRSHPDSKPNSKAVDGLKAVKKEEEVNGTATPQDGRTVLTLFGNAAGHKQLFSSLQQPIGDTDSSQDVETHYNAELLPEIREEILPYGISSTKVIRTESTLPSKPPSTFIDLFAPPPSLHPIAPPKNSKPTNRESPLTFTQNARPEPHLPRSTYATEKLSVGQWLGYAGDATSEEASSPVTKRKQRDGTLSTTSKDTTTSVNEVKSSTTRQEQQAKEDALFRSVYSSFAPSRDNTGAIVPEESKSGLWWQRYGMYAFGRAFKQYPLVSINGDTMDVDPEEVEEDEEASFAAAVAEFDPDMLKAEVAKEKGERDAEQLLEEVSEMIQTLRSFQRIRMSTISPSAADGFGYGYNSSANEKNGPSVPSPEEIETYKALKSQLALIISTLPPFVVSKLDGDQLADLQISRQLPMKVPNFPGVMEEDQASKTARNQAFQAAVGAAQQQQQHLPRTVSTPHQNVARGVSSQSSRPLATITSKGGSTFSRQPLSSWQTSTNNTPMQQRPSYGINNIQGYNHNRPGQTQTPGPARPGSGYGGAGFQQQPPQLRQNYQTNGTYATQNAQNSYHQQQQQQYQRPPSSSSANSYNPTTTQYNAASPSKPNYTAGTAPIPQMQYQQQQRYNQVPPTPQPTSQSQLQPPSQQSPRPPPTAQMQSTASNQQQSQRMPFQTPTPAPAHTPSPAPAAPPTPATTASVT